MLNEYKVGDSKELLKEVESSSVDLIYIDPPYCTGRDFYHFDDRFSSSADYRELFIRPLLHECHRVLTDIGNIVVHVEPKISHHIRIVLDDILGKKDLRMKLFGFLVAITSLKSNYKEIMTPSLSIKRAQSPSIIQSTKIMLMMW